MSELAPKLQDIDWQISARQILPFHQSSKKVLTEHAILLKGGLIVGVLPQDEIDPKLSIANKINLDKHIVVPGFHNAYSSIGARALHHIGSELPLSLRLQNQLIPLKEKHLSQELVSIGSELAIAEMFLSGTSSFNSQFPFLVESADVSQKHQVRANFGYNLNDRQENANFEQALAQFLTLRDDFKHKKGIKLYLSLSNLSELTPSQLNKLFGISNELGLKLQVALDTLNPSLSKNNSRNAIMRLLKQQALFSPDLELTGIHSLTRQEMEHIAATKTQVVICPSAQVSQSNALSPLEGLVSLNAKISLGTDNYISSNLNLWKELQLLVWLAKLESANAQRFCPEQLLNIAIAESDPFSDEAPAAIVNGAIADLAAIECSHDYDIDCDPFEQIVYTANHQAVSHLWVNGVEKVHDYELTDIDHHYLHKTIKKWRNQITK